MIPFCFAQIVCFLTKLWQKVRFLGCVALGIIGLINMTIVYIPLKGYLPNYIFHLPMLLSIRGVNNRAFIDIVRQQIIFKVQQIFNISSLSQVPKLKILQLCDLISYINSSYYQYDISQSFRNICKEWTYFFFKTRKDIFLY